MTEVAKERQLPTGEGLTFEKVWAMFQENREQIREIAEQHKVMERNWDKMNAEANERLKKTERIVKQNSRQMGGLHRSFGEMAEHLVAPGIEKRFNELDYHFSEVVLKGYKIKDVNGRILTEIDILLENGEYVIAVEVKARPELEDIDHHKKRLEILRESRKRINDNRKILGAIAGAIYEDEVKEATQIAGFFAIVQSGDTMRIDMPEGWMPKSF
jgi:DNA repair exonuclease SbcCD ATPase subunit